MSRGVLRDEEVVSKQLSEHYPCVFSVGIASRRPRRVVLQVGNAARCATSDLDLGISNITPIGCPPYSPSLHPSPSSYTLLPTQHLKRDASNNVRPK